MNSCLFTLYVGNCTRRFSQHFLWRLSRVHFQHRCSSDRVTGRSPSASDYRVGAMDPLWTMSTRFPNNSRFSPLPRNPNLGCVNPDAAIAQESQRMLDQVNARIEAQRRGRGLVSGSFGEGGRGGGGNGARAVAEAQIRILAERHGIRLQILNEEQACAVAQIHALAQEHGIRVQIIGDDSVVEGAIIDSNSGGGAGEVGGTGDFSAGRAEKGVRSTSAAAAVTPASGGATPPPLLYSLRLRPGSRPVSPSTASQTSLKVTHEFVIILLLLLFGGLPQESFSITGHVLLFENIRRRPDCRVHPSTIEGR